MPRIPYKSLTKSDELSEKLEMSTAEIGLSVRTTNCLEEKGIFTVHDLLNCTRSDLLSISNFGEKTLEEVYKALEKIHHYFLNQKYLSYFYQVDLEHRYQNGLLKYL